MRQEVGHRLLPSLLIAPGRAVPTMRNEGRKRPLPSLLIAHCSLLGRTIAIPGTLTTAYLALQLCLGKDVPVEVMPFDRILPAVAEGRVEAGLIIHEGQLYYGDRGLHKVVDLGQ